MRKWLMLSSLFFAGIASAEEGCVPVGTITEAIGRIELKSKDGQWQRLLPLQPLCDGDVVRVIGKGHAVLTYLGFSAKTLSLSNSPFTVHEQMIPQSKSQKALLRLREILLGLMSRSRDQTASLMTRNDADAEHKKLQSIRPKCENMLFPLNDIAFQWNGGMPPFALKISEKAQGSEGKSAFEANVLGDSVAVPAGALREKTAYQWTITSSSSTSGGAFQVLGKEESSSILSELAELMDSVSAENEATRILFKYGFFFDKGLYCDAQQMQAAGVKKFPKNDVFRGLALSKDAK